MGGQDMRAVVHDRYGGPEVLRLEEVDRPVPADDEVLVRVEATTVNRSDCGWRSAKPFFARFFTGLRRPKRRILGMEFAGVVEAVGAAVTEFAPGDEVFGVKGTGAHAELTCVRESAAVAHKPAGMTFEEAAAVCDGAVIALTCLRKANLQEGRSIVVYGASGSIGTAGVQLARHLGAEVTAVCNTKNVELVRSLGADEVVDYTQADFTRNGKTYDVVFDAVGKHSFRRCRRSLKPGGVYVETDLGFMWHVPPLTLLTRWFGDKRVTIPIPKYTKEEVLFLKGLIEAGEYRAVIDRRYPLEDVVEATRYVETGQKTGNVVLTVGEAQSSSAISAAARAAPPVSTGR
jgi:NADPH:quinone reductase-like Zn-dependent oxidoreductase